MEFAPIMIGTTITVAKNLYNVLCLQLYSLKIAIQITRFEIVLQSEFVAVTNLTQIRKGHKFNFANPFYYFVGHLLEKLFLSSSYDPVPSILPWGNAPILPITRITAFLLTNKLFRRYCDLKMVHFGRFKVQNIELSFLKN